MNYACMGVLIKPEMGKRPFQFSTWKKEWDSNQRPTVRNDFETRLLLL